MSSVRWAATGRAHHICDVLLLQGDSEVLAEAVGADGALTGGQGLHLVEERMGGRGQKLQLPAGGRGSGLVSATTGRQPKCLKTFRWKKKKDMVRPNVNERKRASGRHPQSIKSRHMITESLFCAVHLK